MLLFAILSVQSNSPAKRRHIKQVLPVQVLFCRTASCWPKGTLGPGFDFGLLAPSMHTTTNINPYPKVDEQLRRCS